MKKQRNEDMRKQGNETRQYTPKYQYDRVLNVIIIEIPFPRTQYEFDISFLLSTSNVVASYSLRSESI